MNGTLIRGCALASAGVLATIALSGCGGGDTTSADPTPSFSSAGSSLSPSPESTSASPVEDSTSAAAGESPEEFVRRWVSLQTAMQNSGSSTEFRAVSTPCSACLGLADLVDGYYAAGGSIETKGWAIEAISCRMLGANATCNAHLQNSATRYKKTASDPQRRLHGGPFDEVFEVSPSGSSWTMTRIAERAS